VREVGPALGWGPWTPKAGRSLKLLGEFSFWGEKIQTGFRPLSLPGFRAEAELCLSLLTTVSCTTVGDLEGRGGCCDQPNLARLATGAKAWKRHDQTFCHLLEMKQDAGATS